MALMARDMRGLFGERQRRMEMARPANVKAACGDSVSRGLEVKLLGFDLWGVVDC